jgi:hypothetical protein
MTMSAMVVSPQVNEVFHIATRLSALERLLLAKLLLDSLIATPSSVRRLSLKLMVENGDLPVEWPGRCERRALLVRAEGMSWGLG